MHNLLKEARKSIVELDGLVLYHFLPFCITSEERVGRELEVHRLFRFCRLGRRLRQQPVLSLRDRLFNAFSVVLISLAHIIYQLLAILAVHSDEIPAVGFSA